MPADMKKLSIFGNAYNEFMKNMIDHLALSPQEIADVAVINFCAFPRLITTDPNCRDIFSQAMLRARTLEAQRYGEIPINACIHERLSNHITSAILDTEVEPIDVDDRVMAFTDAIAAFVWATSEPDDAADNAEALFDGVTELLERMRTEPDDEDEEPSPPTHTVN